MLQRRRVLYDNIIWKEMFSLCSHNINLTFLQSMSFKNLNIIKKKNTIKIVHIQKKGTIGLLNTFTNTSDNYVHVAQSLIAWCLIVFCVGKRRRKIHIQRNHRTCNNIWTIHKSNFAAHTYHNRNPYIGAYKTNAF